MVYLSRLELFFNPDYDLASYFYTISFSFPEPKQKDLRSTCDDVDQAPLFQVLVIYSRLCYGPRNGTQLIIHGSARYGRPNTLVAKYRGTVATHDTYYGGLDSIRHLQ